ncbi:MAG: LytTR family transcriptional regulator DNA-binding domain-containing protein [Bacteroidaceae bacterium]|nr:LytTR family transcriptional regulator DNA-binding domain-containing protein [Bacteroidaceae bacterium]
MIQGQKDIIRVRIISAAFTALALAVFKPFGLEVWQWQAYMHLFFIFILGVMVCLLTDVLMKYIVRKPCNISDSHEDVNYFIRHNLYFQIINTLLVSLMICLYRHFFLSKRVEGNLLSWSNFFETLLIIAFCSFAIGLYWRFKFRSRYLLAELEEVKMMNEQLKALTPTPSPKNEECSITLTGTTSEAVTLDISNLLYIEAVGNYVKVCQWRDGKLQSDMLRATSKQIESELQAYPTVVRCHRAFLVNLTQVEQIVSHSGSMQLHIRHSHEFIPVSRSNMSQVKEGLMKNKG